MQRFRAAKRKIPESVFDDSSPSLPTVHVGGNDDNDDGVGDEDDHVVDNLNDPQEQANVLHPHSIIF